MSQADETDIGSPLRSVMETPGVQRIREGESVPRAAPVWVQVEKEIAEEVGIEVGEQKRRGMGRGVGLG